MRFVWVSGSPISGQAQHRTPASSSYLGQYESRGHVGIYRGAPNRLSLNPPFADLAG
jgi:hypothetical protein